MGKIMFLKQIFIISFRVNPFSNPAWKECEDGCTGKQTLKSQKLSALYKMAENLPSVSNLLKQSGELYILYVIYVKKTDF